MASILIVDDDRNSAEMIASLCEAGGHACAVASDLTDAHQQMLVHNPDLVLLESHLPEGASRTFLENDALRGRTEVVLIAAQASVETSQQALKLGAADYLIKPLSSERLNRVIGRTLSRALAGEKAARPAGRASPDKRAGRQGWQRPGTQGLEGMRGGSPAMREVYHQIRKVAGTSVSVMIVGESGTGKELVAQAIHRLSRRAHGVFKAVNCGAISPQLIESELFGHEKGAFTGAIRQHSGIFEQADDGTLFLDEITEMPADLQVRLLRVLETGVFSRVGSDVTQTTDIRVLAATNRDPLEAVAAGRLREDLYYRLNVFQVQLPPLRERGDDVCLLAEHFVYEINAREDRNLRLSEAALEVLKSHPWPGNVRELSNVIHRAAILCEGSVIDPACLSGEAFEVDSDDTPAGLADAPGDPSATRVLANGRGGPECIPVGVHVGMTLAEAERALVMATLEHNGGSRSRSAEMLGISPKTLYNRLRAYDGEG